jgi:hypothetical protein
MWYQGLVVVFCRGELEFIESVTSTKVKLFYFSWPVLFIGCCRENAVTSCLKCNGRKGSMPVSKLSSIGMKLLQEPRCPTQMELAARAARMVPKRVHPTWKPYLGIAKRPYIGKEEGDEEFIDDRYFEGAAD